MTLVGKYFNTLYVIGYVIGRYVGLFCASYFRIRLKLYDIFMDIETWKSCNIRPHQRSKNSSFSHFQFYFQKNLEKRLFSKQ